jgi:choline dehydrogenase
MIPSANPRSSSTTCRTRRLDPEWRACRAADARAHAAESAAKIRRAEEIQPGPKVRRRGDRRLHPRALRERLSPDAAPARWDRLAIRWPSSIPPASVIGIEGLRVADSSIMPQVTNGNLNAPTLMIGEKASDHILGRDPSPPSNQEPWINPNWRTSQR